MPISVYIVDDHKIFRDGIISLMEYEEDMQVIGAAGSVQEFMEDICNHEPDVILMDISLRDGLGTDALKWRKEKKPNGKILVFSMHREDEFIQKVIACGADGYLLKDEGTETLMKAVRALHKGETFYSQHITQSLVQHLMKGTSPKKTKNGEKLTPRELEVLQLIAEEKTNTEIADLLFISIRTVDTHRRHLLEKLQVKNTVGLVKYAIREGLVEL